MNSRSQRAVSAQQLSHPSPLEMPSCRGLSCVLGTECRAECQLPSRQGGEAAEERAGEQSRGGDAAAPDLDVGALGLQQLADDLPQLVCVRQLPHGAQLGPCTVLGGSTAVRGVHFMQAATESCDLLCALGREGRGKSGGHMGSHSQRNRGAQGGLQLSSGSLGTFQQAAQVSILSLCDWG